MKREIKDCFLLIGMMIFCFSSAYAEQALPAPVQAPAITNAGHALLWGLKLDNRQEMIEKRIKYTVKKGAYIRKVKDDPKDRIEVEVGDIKQDKFCPQVKIKRWDDEVNLAVRLINDEKTPAVSTVGNKIIWRGQKVEAHFYDIQLNQEYPGGYEFEVILKEKPISNKVEFSIQAKGLNFFYQPPLTQEYKNGWSAEFQRDILVSETEVKDKDGKVLVHRPENILGSYAVYYKNCPPNIVGGKEYKTGKALHIYRPRIEDVKGNWVWGELDIDEESGFLTVTIPQDFLDKAVYPVRHAAGLTFGYTIGGSGSTTSCYSYAVAAQFATDASAGGGSATSQTWDLTSPTGGTAFKVALYSEASSLPSIPLATGTSGTIPAGSGWTTVNFATPYTLAASTNYWFSCLASVTGSLIEYDNATVNAGRNSPTYVAFPATPFGAFIDTYIDRRFFVYTTYTAAENDAGFLTIQ